MVPHPDKGLCNSIILCQLSKLLQEGIFTHRFVQFQLLLQLDVRWHHFIHQCLQGGRSHNREHILYLLRIGTNVSLPEAFFVKIDLHQIVVL